MGEPRNWQRNRERLELKLPVRVRCRETMDLEWTEITRLIDVTPFGAGFTLKRPIEKGRLLHMTIPLPRQLRVFDHVEDQYRVWALVRHVRPLPGDEKASLFEVGVAFIGKHPPKSYIDDPSKRYQVGPLVPGQLPDVQEWNPEEIPITDKRVHTRHIIPTDIVIETFNTDGEIEASERTVTENISPKGAAILTSLNVPIGRMIRVSSEQYKVAVHGAVRGASVSASGVSRIHVEFVDRDWPL